ncbi:MAG: DUF362 domain-containing protein [Chitinispirillaceae bacterium]|nr:DUF362 domain-containing protein [Chitinispirillaceae bacterium]
MKRRDFLRYGSGAALGAPLILTPRKHLFASPAKSRLAIVQDPRVAGLLYSTIDEVVINRDEEEELTGKVIDRLQAYVVDQTYVAPMVDEAIVSLTQKESVAAAWESLFPPGQLTAETKIAIKINICYGWEPSYSWNTVMSPFGAKASIVNAIVLGLSQMLDGTFPITNIRVFDRIVDSMTQNNERMVQQGFPASTVEKTYLVAGEGQYGIELVNVDRGADFLSTAPTFEAGPEGKTVTQTIVPPVYESDFMINLTNMKDHYYAGVTGAFKNLFGCIHNCGATHGRQSGEPLNDDGCSPADYLPDVYRNLNDTCPIIVHIMDGLGGLYEGGPTYGRMFSHNMITASTDPVTLDFYELMLVNDARIANGMHAILTPEIFSTNEDEHVNATYLNLAAQYYSLGNLNEGEQIRTPMVGTVIPLPSLQKPQSRLLELKRSTGAYRLGIALDRSGRTHTIESRILNLQGKTVRAVKTIRTSQPMLELEWDGRNGIGGGVARGLYSWEIRVDGIVHHQTVAHF